MAMMPQPPNILRDPSLPGDPFGPIPQILRAQPAPPNLQIIELSDGRLFNVATETRFSIETIAHSLSLACRFGYQPRYFYSVAQHSILVAKLMQHFGSPKIGLEGLLHDAAEFVYGDLATPVKRACTDYDHAEKNLDERIRARFGLSARKTDECGRADKIAMFIEAYDLLPSRGAALTDSLGVRTQAMELREQFRIWTRPMGPELSEAWFLHTYQELVA